MYKKRICSGLLALVMIVEVLIVGVFAEVEGKPKTQPKPKQKFYYSIDVGETKQEILAHTHPKNKVKALITERGRWALYFFIDHQKNSLLDDYVKNFTPKMGSDVEKMQSVIQFIEDRDIIYSKNPKEDIKYQIENVEKGHTMCLGITILGAKLLDKTDLEYRYVLKRKKSRDILSKQSIGPTHINLEVRTDKGRWMEFDLGEVISNPDKIDLKMMAMVERDFANNRDTDEIVERTLTKNMENTCPSEYYEFVVSPPYKNGKMLNNKLKVYNTL